MNIFILNAEPKQAAQDQCDKHVVKMVLESAQLLCGPYNPGYAPYRRTHYNHPCAKWVRKSLDNYLWLCMHGFALCNEYSFRYNKIHKSQDVIKWCTLNLHKLKLPKIGLTEFAQAVANDCRHENAVAAYRSYYRIYKNKIAVWNRGRDAPEWWTD